MGSLNISLPEDLIAEMKKRLPARTRSAFIEAAIRERMELMRQIEAIRDASGAWSNEGRGDPEEEVRRQRAGWAARDARTSGNRGAP